MRKSHILAIACLCASTAHATVVEYFDDAALFKQADIIVAANVWRWDLRQGEGFEYTDYELEAVECFKGCRDGQFLMMSSPGVPLSRTLPGSHEYIAGAPHPEHGDRVIVYLEKQPGGDYQLLSLGLSMYRLHYNGALHRYIAHRETESLVALRPAPAGVARAPDNQVIVPADQFASDVIDQLRSRAKAR